VSVIKKVNYTVINASWLDVVWMVVQCKDASIQEFCWHCDCIQLCSVHAALHQKKMSCESVHAMV